jgi:hypothetical protein
MNRRPPPEDIKTHGQGSGTAVTGHRFPANNLPSPQQIRDSGYTAPYSTKENLPWETLCHF